MTKSLRVVAFTRCDFSGFQLLQEKRWWGWSTIDREDVPAHVRISLATVGDAGGWVSRFANVIDLPRPDQSATNSDGGLSPGNANVGDRIGRTRRPAHPMDTISGGPTGPSDLIAVLEPLARAADAFDDKVYGDAMKLSTEKLTLGMLRKARDLYRSLVSAAP